MNKFERDLTDRAPMTIAAKRPAQVAPRVSHVRRNSVLGGAGSVVIALVVVLGITAANTSRNTSASVATTGQATQAPDITPQSVAAPAETAPQATTAPTTPPTAAPTTPPTAAPTTPPTAPPTPKPPSVSGRGDRVVSVPAPFNDGPAMLLAVFHGSDNFIVESLGPNNSQGELLVNTIGNYQGYVAMNFQGDSPASHLQITGSGGSWSITFLDPASAAPFDSAKSGRGDDVLIYTGQSAIAMFKSSGQDNFIVIEYPEDSSPNLLVNEIGAYDGSVPISSGPSFIVIQADGDWSISTAPG